MKRALLLLAACSSPAKPPVVEKPVAAEAPEVACPAAPELKLADGKLRCRELPLVLDFPAATTLKRVDQDNLTFFNAELDRGVLALFVEPRFNIEDDTAGIRLRLETVAKIIAEDVTIGDATAPAQPGATITAAISFTTKDGGAGVAYGYIAHGWFVGVFAGGRQVDTPARPDKPVGKAFLSSLKLRPTTTTWETQTVFETTKLELPHAGWEGAPQKPTGPERASRLFTWPAERVWIGARSLEPSPKCTLFDGMTEADVPNVLKKLFGRDDLETRGSIKAVGTKALYGEVETGVGGTMTLYLVCNDPTVTLITVTGKRPPTELQKILDRVTSTFPRATP